MYEIFLENKDVSLMFIDETNIVLSAMENEVILRK